MIHRFRIELAQHSALLSWILCPLRLNRSECSHRAALPFELPSDQCACPIELHNSSNIYKGPCQWNFVDSPLIAFEMAVNAMRQFSEPLSTINVVHWIPEFTTTIAVIMADMASYGMSETTAD